MYVLEYGFGAGSTPTGFAEDFGASLQDWFARKYRHWRGRSGRPYVFSAYTPLDCPPYEDAVLIVSENDVALACVDTGSFPDVRIAELRARFADRLARVEFQVHVLADGERARRSAIEDLSRARLDA